MVGGVSPSRWVQGPRYTVAVAKEENGRDGHGGWKK
jgi:hypothetical protein